MQTPHQPSRNPPPFAQSSTPHEGSCTKSVAALQNGLSKMAVEASLRSARIERSGPCFAICIVSYRGWRTKLRFTWSLLAPLRLASPVSASRGTTGHQFAVMLRTQLPASGSTGVIRIMTRAKSTAFTAEPSALCQAGRLWPQSSTRRGASASSKDCTD